VQTLDNNETYFEVVFDKLSLAFSDLSGCEFEDCEFNDCDFRDMTLTQCKFVNCTFNRCNMSLMKVPRCRFYELAFNDCKLLGVDWTRATWSSFHLSVILCFKRCVLNDNSFFGLSLNELQLEECKLHDADFREADLSNAVMQACDFSHSLFAHTNLYQADLSDSYHFTLNVLDNNIAKAKFSRYEALSLLTSLGIELVD